MVVIKFVIIRLCIKKCLCIMIVMVLVVRIRVFDVMYLIRSCLVSLLCLVSWIVDVGIDVMMVC